MSKPDVSYMQSEDLDFYSRHNFNTDEDNEVPPCGSSCEIKEKFLNNPYEAQREDLSRNIKSLDKFLDPFLLALEALKKQELFLRELSTQYFNGEIN